jgi:PAT family beta-lactamase induction signal transducer AmpG
MVAIGAENLAVGFASAAAVAYLSAIVNPKYAAVQYALLASLTMLIGSLGRGALGELIEARGYAYVFYLTAALGIVAIVASGLEWARQAREAQLAKRLT